MACSYLSFAGACLLSCNIIIGDERYNFPDVGSGAQLWCTAAFAGQQYWVADVVVRAKLNKIHSRVWNGCRLLQCFETR
jgi:hypothetical protein